MMTPLPCCVILQEATMATTGAMLIWSALEAPQVWKGKVPASGRLVLTGPMARAVAETLWGLIWEAHKTERGIIGRGMNFRTEGGE